MSGTQVKFCTAPGVETQTPKNSAISQEEEGEGYLLWAILHSHTDPSSFSGFRSSLECGLYLPALNVMVNVKNTPQSDYTRNAFIYLRNDAPGAQGSFVESLPALILYPAYFSSPWLPQHLRIHLFGKPCWLPSRHRCVFPC